MTDDRRVTTENCRASSIDDFVHDFYYIFREKDKERSLLDIWMHAVEHASRLAEEIRRERYDRLQQELAGVFAWVASFVANCGSREEPAERIVQLKHPLLSDIVWKKYPACCPVCIEPECSCLARLAEVEERNHQEEGRVKRERRAKLAARVEAKRGEKLTNIVQIEEMFYGTFKRSIFAFPIESIGLHLLEEIGEVSIAITETSTYVQRDKDHEPTAEEWDARIDGLEGEIADVMSWLFALSCKLRETFRVFDRYVAVKPQGAVKVELAPHLYLVDSIMQKYSRGGRGNKLECRHCDKAPCECRIYFVNTSERADRLLRSR